MVESKGYAGEQEGVDGLLGLNLVYVGTVAMDAASKLCGAHPPFGPLFP